MATKFCAACNKEIKTGEAIRSSLADTKGTGMVLCEPCSAIEEIMIEAAGTCKLPDVLNQYRRNLKMRREQQIAAAGWTIPSEAPFVLREKKA